MGTKAKKATKNNLKRVNAKLSVSINKIEGADFLVRENFVRSPWKVVLHANFLNKKCQITLPRFLYVGRKHGFYETEMEGYFGQFGTIKRLRIARNKRTGKSRHFGFIEFESPEVAKIIVDTMHNYLLFEHLLQAYLIPPEHVHPKLWRGFNYHYKPLDSVQIERERHDKERTLEEHKKLIEKIVKRDQKRQKRIEAADIDYECPEIVGNNQPAPNTTRNARFNDGNLRGNISLANPPLISEKITRD